MWLFFPELNQHPALGGWAVADEHKDTSVSSQAKTLDIAKVGYLFSSRVAGEKEVPIAQEREAGQVVLLALFRRPTR
jgi:hypothetical protein